MNFHDTLSGFSRASVRLDRANAAREYKADWRAAPVGRVVLKSGDVRVDKDVAFNQIPTKGR